MAALLLLNIAAARTLSVDDFSAFATASSAIPLLAMVATMGVPFVLIRALRGQLGEPGDESAILRGAVRLALIGCAVTSLAYMGATGSISTAPRWSVMRDSPWLVSAWFSLSALCIVAAHFFQGIDDFRTAGLIGARSGGLLANGLAALATGIAAATGQLTLPLLLSFNVLFCLASLAFAAVVQPAAFLPKAARRYGPAVEPAAGGRSHRYGPVWYLRESWPNLINQLTAIVLVEGDLLLVAYLASEEVVALYAAIRHLRMLVLAPKLMASVSLAPFVAELHGKRDFGRLERMLRGTATLIAGPSLAALVPLVLAPSWVIEWTFGPNFVDAAEALRITTVGCIIFVLSGSNGLTLTMTGRHRDLMVISLGSLGLYLVVSPLLIANYGIVGAAVAFTLQTSIQNILVTLRVKQLTGLWTVPICSIAVISAELGQLIRRSRLKAM
jgi:O-antigen/teichoic acid export membrane protein